MRYTIEADIYCLVTFTDNEWSAIINAFENSKDVIFQGFINKPSGWLYTANNNRGMDLDGEFKISLCLRHINYIIEALANSSSYLSRSLIDSLKKLSDYVLTIDIGKQLLLNPINNV